jgi:hypothetical protein
MKFFEEIAKFCIWLVTSKEASIGSRVRAKRNLLYTMPPPGTSNICVLKGTAGTVQLLSDNRSAYVQWDNGNRYTAYPAEYELA